MNQKEIDITQKRKARIRQKNPNADIVLYGSHARGQSHKESDWDILIILDKEKLEPEDYDKVSFPLTMLGWDLGARINPIMYTMKEWAASCITPFYKNVEQEGIELV